MLLNIPPQKTLLRRHLTTKFNALIGPEAEQEKREKMTSPAYTPLTTTAKVRVSGGHLLRRSSGPPPALMLYSSDPAPGPTQCVHLDQELSQLCCGLAVSVLVPGHS